SRARALGQLRGQHTAVKRRISGRTASRSPTSAWKRSRPTSGPSRKKRAPERTARDPPFHLRGPRFTAADIAARSAGSAPSPPPAGAGLAPRFDRPPPPAPAPPPGLAADGDRPRTSLGLRPQVTHVARAEMSAVAPV